MKLLLTAAVATALPHVISAALCATATLSKLLTDQYIDRCASDSGYSFISGVKPDPEEVSGMCESDACHSLLADVEAINLTECTLPIGDQIYLFADLVDYVSHQCDATTPAPATAAPTPAPTAATPAPTTAIASCTSAQLKYLLTSTYEKQCITDTGFSFTSPYSPTAAQVASMCASESCVNLFAYVASMVTTDCRIPVGGKILLLADLVDYVSDQCSASTDTPSTTVPATDSPSTPTPTPSTPRPTTATPVTTCVTKVISSLLTDAYIDQCASDSGYSFTSGVQPDATEVAGMCASSACASLLADVEALGLSECILPIGNKIYLFRDLVDYVSDQCSASTDTPSTTVPATDSPSTPTPTPSTPTPTPSTPTPTPTAATPAPTTAIASCTSAQLKYLLTSTYEKQCITDTGFSFTSPYSPTAAQVASMCASESCVNLFAYVASMVTTDCRIPVGGKILLLADLVDYVSDQCSASTDTPSTTVPATDSPSTPTPTPSTPTPSTPTPTPTAATPAPTTAIASCTSAQLKYLLTSTYEKQCITDTGFSFTSPYSPTAAQVASMCASESCVNLFAYVASMVTTDCRIPVGGKILLLADLVDYVSDQCSASTDTPSTTVPATDSPSTPTPTPSTPRPTTATPVTTCVTKVISSLLTDAYIDQCASDSGYSFTSGVQPDATEVAGMCASSACASLLADVEALGLSECILPIGNKIYLFRDLVDYVSDQCSASTDTPSTTVPATDSPSTPTPTPSTPTPTPSTPTPTPTAATPAPTTAIASCTSAQLKYLLTSTYEKQCITDTGFSFTSPYSPTAAQVASMCASESCVNLFAYVASMVTTDCRIPVGGKILLLADLVDYVSDQCSASTDTPSTTVPATDSPSTPTPTPSTPTPSTPTPTPTAATPAPTTAIASCTSAQLKYLLTSTYEKQCITDTGFSFTSPYSPTAAQVASMCASESCVNLFAYVASMVTTDCRIPVGGKILLLADLVDYVSDQCSASTDTPSTTVPATDSPSTPTPTPTPSTPTPTTATPVTTCATKVISSLLTDAYIDQCASDSGYSFTSGIQPDATEVAGMCASSACANLLADVKALGLSECILPIGNKIYLFRDLVDYVSDQCSASTDTPSTTVPATDSPSTPSITTATPSTEAPGSVSPSTTAPPTGSSSGSTSTTESPNPGTSTPSTDSPSTHSPGTDIPTTDTPEPTSPIHDSC